MERLYPLCRSITGDGVRRTLDVIAESVPLARHAVAVRDGGARLDGQRRVERARRLDRGRERAPGRRLPGAQPAPGQLQRPGARADDARASCARTCTRCPTTRTGSPTGPPTTTAPGASASPSASSTPWTSGPYDVVVDSTLEPGELTYGELVIPGDSDGRGAAQRPRVPPLAGQRQPLRASRWPPSSRATLAALPRRRWTYRFLFAPGTIGSITWLSRNPDRLASRSGTAWCSPAWAVRGRWSTSAPGTADRADRPGRRATS